MITSDQIIAILKLQGSYSLITGAATLTDISNYGGLGIASPNTVKVLFYIQNPTGQLLYKNTGYDTANFASPDIEPVGGSAVYSFTLPADITGAYLTGQYYINMKIQVVQGANTTLAAATLYQNVSATCNGIIPVVNGNVSYNSAQVSVTDNTNYKTFTVLNNTVTLYPPATTGQASQAFTAHGSPATLIWVSPGSTFPYTGVWTWALQSDITYTDPVTNASTMCRITAQGTFTVNQSNLCRALCFINDFRAQFYAQKGQVNSNLMQQNLQAAEGELTLAMLAERCGSAQSVIDDYVQKIYGYIGLTDPNCPCKCNDGTSQQLIPTSSINGTNGDNGLSFLQGTGVPSGGIGVVGDTYLNNANGDIYLKTGASAWTFKINITGPSGSTGSEGPSGSAGANGTGLVWSDATNHSTGTTGTFTQLALGINDSTNPGKNFVNVGDTMKIFAVFEQANPNAIQASQTRILFSGGSITDNAGGIEATFGNAFGRFEYEVLMVLTNSATGNNAVRVFTTIKKYAPTTGDFAWQGSFERRIVDLNGFNFATTDYGFVAQSKNVIANDTILKEWRCEILKAL